MLIMTWSKISLVFSDEPTDIGNYDEQSIRYRGRNIPSKSFRMLESMTGGPAPAPGQMLKAKIIKYTYII